MDEVVESTESIARFIRNQSDMRLGLGRPKYSAFLPRVQDGEISVFRTAGLGAVEIKALGAAYVAKPNSPIKGHCVQLASDFFSEGLHIEAAPHPHPSHANVKGWVMDSRNRIIAKKLADKAALTVYD